MKIGILGGTFDPPHLGHLVVANQIKEYLSLDEVWLMPVYSHAFDKNLSSARHRLEMTKLIEHDFIRASDYEVRRKEKSYTVDTLQLLQKERPKDTFYFCIGSDTLEDFQRWKDWDNLVSEHRIVVYPRGFDVRKLYQTVCRSFDCDPLPENITVVSGADIIITNISSSLVRRKIKEKKAVDFIVPKHITRYIFAHDLYR